jgi:colanic acid/amylovoran biosynthesis glycosyltransferase
MSAPTSGGIRLGYLVSQYPATNHTFILREIRTLRRLGFDIDVVSVRKSDRPAEVLSANEADELSRTFSVLGAGAGGVLSAHLRTLLWSPRRYLSGLANTFRLAAGDLPKSFRYLLYFAEAVTAGDYFRRRGVGHVHTHFASTVTLMMNSVFPIGYSMMIHGPDEFNDVAGFHMAEKVARSVFTNTISQFAASQTMRASDPKHWDRVLVTPLGVDPQAFAPIADRQPQTGKFGLLTVARLAPAKAQHVLLAGVEELVRRGRTGVRLTVVGDGPSRASLEAMIADRGLDQYVKLAGSCNHDKVRDFYRNTDAFVLPSFAEGVPVVLMEAMSMQVPCVSTWIAGTPELIRDGVDGLLIPPASPGALADAVERLMDDAELRRRLGAAGRQRVSEKYNLAQNTELLAVAFRERLGTSVLSAGAGV